MMFLYISMVISSYIVIVSGMGDDVPILGALVTLLKAMGYCFFFYDGHLVVWSFGQNTHLVNMVIWSSGYLVIMFI